MGNDGGSIPGRQDLVKEMARVKREETEELVKLSKSQFCSMTKEPFNPPLAGDRLGQIYNKKAVIINLLQKTTPKGFNHIKSLKDIKELKTQLSNSNALMCPISMIEFTGINKFYFLWNCGCVVSSKAIKELNMTSSCIVCGKAFDPENGLVSLNYSNKDKEDIKTKLINESVKTKQMHNKLKEANEAQTVKLLSRKRTKTPNKDNKKDKVIKGNEDNDDDVDLNKAIRKRKKIK